MDFISRANYQRKIAGYWKEAELFEIVYCVLILVLMDRYAVSSYNICYYQSYHINLIFASAVMNALLENDAVLTF